MDDPIMQAAVRAYEYATSDDDSIPLRGLRAAVSVALEIQREEIAAAIEAAAWGNDDRYDQAIDRAAEIAREHGKES